MKRKLKFVSETAMEQRSGIGPSSHRANRSWDGCGAHNWAALQKQRPILELHNACVVVIPNLDKKETWHTIMGNLLSRTSDVELLVAFRHLPVANLEELQEELRSNRRDPATACTKMNVARGLMADESTVGKAQLVELGVPKAEIEAQLSLEAKVVANGRVSPQFESNDGGVPADGEVYFNVYGGKFKIVDDEDPVYIGPEVTEGAYCRLRLKEDRVAVHPVGVHQSYRTTTVSIAWFRKLVGPAQGQRLSTWVKDHNAWVEAMTSPGGKDAHASVGTPNKRRRMSAASRPSVSDWLVMERIKARSTKGTQNPKSFAASVATKHTHLREEKGHDYRLDDAFDYLERNVNGSRLGPEVWAELAYRAQLKCRTPFSTDQCDKLRNVVADTAKAKWFSPPLWLGR